MSHVLTVGCGIRTAKNGLVKNATTREDVVIVGAANGVFVLQTASVHKTLRLQAVPVARVHQVVAQAHRQVAVRPQVAQEEELDVLAVHIIFLIRERAIHVLLLHHRDTVAHGPALQVVQAPQVVAPAEAIIDVITGLYMVIYTISEVNAVTTMAIVKIRNNCLLCTSKFLINKGGVTVNKIKPL